MEVITKAAIEEASDYIRSQIQGFAPEVAIVLGSGMGDLDSMVKDPVVIPYEDVPHMHTPKLSGHAGNFLLGTMEGRKVICMQGRIHLYEGYTVQEIAFPVFVMSNLGAQVLVITNAAGGINTTYGVGDLMLITDHINLLQKNPCTGMETNGLCETFFDMTHAYSPRLGAKAAHVAFEKNITLRTGVYIATAGPSFETPAEIRAFRTLGADAVGMSTIYEVLAANSCHMEVLGISLISNPAAGVSDELLSGEDVARAAAAAASNMETLITGVLREL